MFADDCLLDEKIKNQDDARTMQDEIDSLQIWEKEWQMEHCQMRSHPHCNKEEPHHLPKPNTPDNNQAKCFGVTITPDFSWKCHINNITKRANPAMAFHRRQSVLGHKMPRPEPT